MAPIVDRGTDLFYVLGEFQRQNLESHQNLERYQNLESEKAEHDINRRNSKL
jgi:hypothetical protein